MTKGALATVSTLLLLTASGWLLSAGGQNLVPIALVAVCVLVAFLLGLGCGERSGSAFRKHLMRVNRMLGQQNRELCEANLRLIQDLDPDLHRPEDNGSQPSSATDLTPRPSVISGIRSRTPSK